MTSATKSPYAGYRFPGEVISHAVWLYFRFPLSLRMVEEMLAARGIDVSHETVRQRARKFGQSFANQIRRKLPGPGDKWHLDEVCLMIRGQKHWLWRAVRPGWGCARRSGPEPARQEGRQTSASQAAEAADPRASCDDHGQAGELQRRERRGDALGRASEAQRFKQQSGEFAPADPTTRAADEAVQVARPGSTLPLRPRSDQQLVPPPPRSPPRQPVSSRPNPSLPDLGRGHRRGRAGIGLRGTGLRVPCRDQSRSS